MSDIRVFVQVKLSALRASLSAVTVLLVGLAMIPVRAIISRLIDGTWPRTDWVLAAKVIGVLAFAWFAVLFVTNFLDLRRSGKLIAEANPEFRGSAFIRVVYGGGVLLSSVLVWGLRQQHEPAWQQCIFMVFAALAFFCWPRTIRLSPTGVSQRSRFGVLHVLRYTDVDYISYDKSRHTTTVVGRDTTITHTEQHADADFFQRLLEERTGKMVNEDGQRE